MPGIALRALDELSHLIHTTTYDVKELVIRLFIDEEPEVLKG